MSTPPLLDAIRSLLPIVAVLVAIGLENIRRVQRQRQFLMPAVALVYSIIALAILYRFNAWFEGVLQFIFSHVPFLEGFYNSARTYSTQTTVLLLIFFGLKLAYRPLAGRFFNGSSFPGSALVLNFYEYEPAAGRWFLQPKWGQTRVLFRVAAWVSAFLMVIYVGGSHMAPNWPGFDAPAFPAIAVLLVAECYYALNGYLYSESAGTLIGEADDATRISNYARLREILARTFSDRVLTQDVELSGLSGFSSAGAIREMVAADERRGQAYAEYFERAKLSGAKLDENLVEASLGLLAGTSTLIANPFHHDLTTYLALPAYVTLLQGGKVLVVVGRDSATAEVQEWITDGLEQISGSPGLWEVGVLTTRSNDELDVGILQAGDLHDLEILRANDAFFGDVEYVLISEPSRVLATEQLGMGLVASRCRRHKKPVYAAFDRNHDGLVDALSHLLQVSLTDVVATQAQLGANSSIVWRAEEGKAEKRLLPGLARYLGGGTELGALALKYHVSEVEWVGGDRFPVLDMSWIAGQYYKEITGFAELEPSQHALARSLVPRVNPANMPQSSRSFLIVEDEASNVFESVRAFSSRSTENGFVNLLSEDYLFRDYMTENRHVFTADPKAIPSVVPDFAGTERNFVLALLLEMAAFGVSEETIISQVQARGIPVPALEEEIPAQRIERTTELLEGLVEKYTGVRPSSFDVERVSTGADGGTDLIFKIPARSNLWPVVDGLGAARFTVEDEGAGKNIVGACLRSHVPQTLLPGQFVTYGGKYYEVAALGQEPGGNVLLRRASEHITGRPVYRHKRSVELADIEPVSSGMRTSHGSLMTLHTENATVMVTTHGYHRQETRSHFDDDLFVSVEDVPEREYRQKNVLRIDVGSAPPDVVRTLVLLLNELFVTLFPLGHPFLVVAAETPASESEEGVSVDSMLPSLRVSGGSPGSIYIVEDSTVDLGLILAIERNWVRIMNMISDYLGWASSDPATEVQTDHGVVRFSGDDDDDLLQRQDLFAALEAGEVIEIEAPLSCWKRITGTLTRSKKREEVPDEPAQ